MLCCCSTNSLVAHFLPHQKVLNQVCKWSPYNWSLCCLALFLAQKKLYFFIVELFKRLHSLLVLTKKDIREKNAVIAVRASSFQFLKTASQLFSFWDSPEGCKARTTNIGCLPLEIFDLSSVKRMVLNRLLLVLCQYRSLNAQSNGIHYP